MNPINSNTKLSELIENGADTVGDISIQEWLEYLRNSALEASKDLNLSDDEQDNADAVVYAELAGKLEEALEIIG